MILFDADLLANLKNSLKGETIHSITLFTSGIEFCIGEITISCHEEVTFCISGLEYEWRDAPNATPFGVLLRQTVVDVELVASDRARISLDSGDSIDILTCRGPHESVIVQYPSEGTSLTMDIY